ncbi:Starch-binding associating with outer membrane [Chryseobacterium piscicola]|uniref:RagB/SusD family nutrient uptake outer membrane protein n=1 Tax=Chryseobacterium piscicola TaxID=551459 RepID=A0A1N7LXY9_9FLAO|nr:RagB/SusD family nutrient uptake outer membrane protein [Chryseobacterium piscicola]PQA92553.1 RagB/SusD family nutrient uptake outer membrane protein [Chryseobacterium piscicola]SIS78662.1 Starch-binding associating with outer membrane [Chryseobacterium piscicola]
MKLNKTIYYFLLGATFTITATSCSDYLDTEPLTDKIIPLTDTPYKTASEAEGLMTAIYVDLGNEYWQLDYFFNGDAQTDIAHAGSDNVQNFQIDEYRIIATNSNVNRDWNYLFTLINNCNKILNYVDNIPDTALTNSRKAEMKAEAAIMRAMYNFHGVQLWGDFPLVTKAVIGVNDENFDEVYEQIYPKRKSVNEVYSQIIADLEGALASAPASSNKYKATKGLALSLLAKVHATKPNPDYAKVIDYTTQLMGEGYSLLPNYDHLFDGNHEANAESIFESNGNAGNLWAWGSLMFYGTDWKKFNTPSYDIVNTFNTENDNVRKNASILFSTNTVNWSDNYWQSNNFPFMYKMRITSGHQNFYVMRYADLLLIRAEALVRQGNFTEAAALVNQVRARASSTLAPITIANTDDGINKILKERKLELAFEGHRWFDLKRTGKAISILSQQKNAQGNLLPYVNNLNQNRLLWPIPQTQLDNNPNLTQNPGY